MSLTTIEILSFYMSGVIFLTSTRWRSWAFCEHWNTSCIFLRIFIVNVQTRIHTLRSSCFRCLGELSSVRIWQCVLRTAWLSMVDIIFKLTLTPTSWFVRNNRWRNKCEQHMQQVDDVIRSNLLAVCECVCPCLAVMDRTGLCWLVGPSIHSLKFFINLPELFCSPFPDSVNLSKTTKLLWKGPKPSNVIMWITRVSLLMVTQMATQEIPSVPRRQLVL